MAPKAGIPEGFELLVGRGRENAIKAIQAAEERGFGSETVRVSTTLGGFLIPLGYDAPAGESEVAEVKAEEIVFPDPDKANHAEIDEFAANFADDLGGPITYEGIEAKDADKPTKAEKVAHIQKIVGERAAENDKHADETGELRSSAEGAEGAEKGE